MGTIYKLVRSTDNYILAQGDASAINATITDLSPPASGVVGYILYCMAGQIVPSGGLAGDTLTSSSLVAMVMHK